MITLSSCLVRPFQSQQHRAQRQTMRKQSSKLFVLGRREYLCCKSTRRNEWTSSCIRADMFFICVKSKISRVYVRWKGICGMIDMLLPYTIRRIQWNIKYVIWGIYGLICKTVFGCFHITISHERIDPQWMGKNKFRANYVCRNELVLPHSVYSRLFPPTTTASSSYTHYFF